MGIVINEFEAVAQAPAPAAKAERAGEEEGKGADRPDPAKLAAALRELAEQTARVWAH